VLIETNVRLLEPRSEAEAVEVPPRGDIQLESVAFSYSPGVPVIHSTTLHIPAGQHMAIVGATGAGKSALAGLIVRTYDPTAGRISYGGKPLFRFRLADLQARIVLVSQEAPLISGSIADNIAITEPETNLARAEQALERIGVAGWFDRFPGGLSTPVGKTSLSAGERQLVSLARLALLDPGVIVLDEATAQLEPKMEATVAATLGRVASGRTLISICHRLDTTRTADRVVVLSAGRVVEDGPPDSLLAAGRDYSDLWAAWIGQGRPVPELPSQ
jgi:ATP-binding cassette subfamily B protein